MGQDLYFYIWRNYCINYGRFSWEFPLHFEAKHSVSKRSWSKFWSRSWNIDAFIPFPLLPRFILPVSKNVYVISAGLWLI